MTQVKKKTGKRAAPPPAKVKAVKKKVGPFPYNVGSNTVSVIIEGKTHTVPKVSEVAQAIRSGNWAKVSRLVAPGKAIAKAMQSVRGAGDVVLRDDGQVSYRGRVLNNGSAGQIKMLMAEGFPVASELRTLDSLMRHDDTRVHQHFEDFIQRWSIPRLEDGRLVLYKRVKDDLTSSHDSFFAYRVGAWAELSWEEVDRDPHQTCSRGLHAAPLEALHNFAGFGGVILELHVWPEDFAALPIDYIDNGKVRLRRFYVAAAHKPEDLKAA